MNPVIIDSLSSLRHTVTHSDQRVLLNLVDKICRTAWLTEQFPKSIEKNPLGILKLMSNESGGNVCRRLRS